MIENDDQLRDLASELPWERPEPARRDAVRSALLVAASESDRRPTMRWYVMCGVFAAGALAAACVLLLLVQKPQPYVASAARIDASEAAQLERKVTRTPTGIDEVVRVRAGRVNLGVGALRAGDHVRVATRDAEVEGEGQYEVAVQADRLSEVRVIQGHATIRITGQQSVFLASGQTWRATVITGDLTPPRQHVEPSPATSSTGSVSSSADRIGAQEVAKVRARHIDHPIAATTATFPRAASDQSNRAAAPTEHPAVRDKSAASMSSEEPAASISAPQPIATARKQLEQHFKTGMQLLKAGNPAAASRELGAAADAGIDDPLAADARYFQAVALTKSGRKTEAERALVAFLDHAPTSIRRGRAAVMLARLIAERGDIAAARAWFESALGDADAAVAAAAKAGIAARH